MRPVRNRSAAAREVKRSSSVTLMTAGASASLTSVSANETDSAAITMSAAPTMPKPPARTGPASSTTTGRVDVAI